MEENINKTESKEQVSHLSDETILLAADIFGVEDFNENIPEIEKQLLDNFGMNLEKMECFMSKIKERLTTDFSIMDYKIASGFRPTVIQNGDLLFRKEVENDFLIKREELISSRYKTKA